MKHWLHQFSVAAVTAMFFVCHCSAQFWDKMPETSESFQYDYCSYLHSQYVIDRINSEVRPIFYKYDVSMVQGGDLCLITNFAEYEQ